MLAFDFGLKHIGVATGQTVTRTANPLTTLKAKNGRPDWQELTRIVNEWQPGCLIVGLPLNMDDTESEMSTLARKFAARLERETRLPVALVDERLSSFAAKEIDAQDNHAIAASLIAQTWLSDDS